MRWWGSWPLDEFPHHPPLYEMPEHRVGEDHAADEGASILEPVHVRGQNPRKGHDADDDQDQPDQRLRSRRHASHGYFTLLYFAHRVRPAFRGDSRRCSLGSFRAPHEHQGETTVAVMCGSHDASGAAVLLSASSSSAALVTVNFIFTDSDFSGSFTYDDATGAANSSFPLLTQYDVTAISVAHSIFGSWDLSSHFGTAQVIAVADSTGQFAVLDEPFDQASFPNPVGALNLLPPAFISPSFPPGWLGLRTASLARPPSTPPHPRARRSPGRPPGCSWALACSSRASP